MVNLKFKIQNLKFRRLWVGIGILIVLSPLGLLLSELLKSDGAWGEWGAEEIKKIAGYIPAGFKNLSGIWRSPVSDYSVPGLDSGIKSYIGYIVSGVIGVLLVVGISILVGKILARKNGNS